MIDELEVNSTDTVVVGFRLRYYKAIYTKLYERDED